MTGSSDQTALNKATVQRYAAQLRESGLSASTINRRLSAIRKLAAEASDKALPVRVPSCRMPLTSECRLLSEHPAHRNPQPIATRGSRDGPLSVIVSGAFSSCSASRLACSPAVRPSKLSVCTAICVAGCCLIKIRFPYALRPIHLQK